MNIPEKIQLPTSSLEQSCSSNTLVKTALVLGSSQGLGLYISRRLSEVGWSVSGVGRRDLDAQVTEGFDYLQLDMSRLEGLTATGEVLKQNSPNLIVVNQVAYDTKGQNSVAEDMDYIFRVNATMPYILLRNYLLSLDVTTDCCCIFINSDSIHRANQYSGVYAASKAALRVLTSALADMCRKRNAYVATLLLGPLADQTKLSEMESIANRTQKPTNEIIRQFLFRSNPSLVIENFIDFETCFQSILYMSSLGHTANGMMCKLDGGSSGSI